MLAQHRKQLEEQLADLQANLDEVRVARARGAARCSAEGARSAPARAESAIDVYVNVNCRSAMADPRFRAAGPRLRSSACATSFARQAAMTTIGATLGEIEPGRVVDRAAVVARR